MQSYNQEDALLNSPTLLKLHELSKFLTLDTQNEREFKDTLKLSTKLMVQAMDKGMIQFTDSDAEYVFRALMVVLIDHSVDGKFKQMFEDAKIH